MSKIGEVITSVGKAIGQAAETYANTSSAAAAKANGVSAAAQAAQGAFNAGQAALANTIGDQRINQQMSFNSGQAQMANAFTSEMWDKTAAWNEMMWQKQAEFNSREAQKQRDWQTEMANTAYQRAYTDMKAAGINPVLASGATPVMPSGGAASVGGANMSSATGQAASSGLLGANAATESSYAGQMETMNNTMALIAAAMNGMTTAAKSMQTLGGNGNDFAKFIWEIATGDWGALKDRYYTKKAQDKQKAMDKIKESIDSARTKAQIKAHSNK